MIKSFVYNCLKAVLAWEAGLVRSRYSGPVITISGSVGKTSTKDAIGLLVRKKYGAQALVTPKSLNTEIGVPLTLLGFKKQPTSALGWIITPFKGLIVALFGKLPTCMVLELGTDRKGDIAYLGRLVRPTHAIITDMSEAHSALLGGIEAVRQEESSLLQFVSLDGVVILNGDDPYMAQLKVGAQRQKIVVRLHQRADYFTSGIKVSLEGTEAILHHGNRTQRVRIQRYGEHHLYSLLFMASIGDCLDISATQQQQVFKELKAVPGRGQLLEGRHGSLILDDSYNAQPAAMKAALQTLAHLPAKKRVAILGDMRELANPEALHRDIGKLAHSVADYIIAVGPLSRNYKADEWFMTAQEAIPSALRQLGPDVMVLVKGSQNTIRLERVVKALMLHPEQAPHLLVRQEKEWERIA